MSDMEAVENLLFKVGLQNWFVLNIYQAPATRAWFCNLQRRTNNGTTEEVFTEYGTGQSMREAVKAAIARIPHATPRPPLEAIMEPVQEQAPAAPLRRREPPAPAAAPPADAPKPLMRRSIAPPAAKPAVKPGQMGFLS